MFRPFSIRTFIRTNYLLYLLAAVLIVLIYANTLYNEFAVVDDLQGIVQNDSLQDLGANLKTLRLQPMLYALMIHFFGMTPLPFHILSLISHIMTTFLLSVILYSLFHNRSVAWLGTLLFAVHPVNTESVNWISAQFYIVHALFAYGAIIAYIKYRMTRKMVFLFSSAGIILIELILIRHPWVLIAPMIITMFELFYRETGLRWKPFLIFWGILIPATYILLFMDLSGVSGRLSYREPGGGQTLVNDQALIPILESYPYTLTNMSRLYLMPKTLTIYYDGTQSDSLAYLTMFAVALLYLTGLVYFFKKNRLIWTFLVILPAAIAPCFSPVKVTWYITERYLYLGSGFFVGLLFYSLNKLEQKTSIKYLTLICGILIIAVASWRTYLRNEDWKSPATLAKATIQTSPLSVRPYNDLAGYYVMQGRIDEAKKLYQKAMTIYPSTTSLHNLGYIYMTTGLDPSIHTTSIPFAELLSRADTALQQKDLRAALFYNNEALSSASPSARLYNSIGFILTETSRFDQAHTYLEKAVDLEPANAQTFFYLGYLAYKEGNIEDAKNYLQKTLELDPTNKQAQTNLEYLNNQ